MTISSEAVMTLNEAVVIEFNVLSLTDWIVTGADKNIFSTNIIATPISSDIRNTRTAYFDDVK
jgi:hypothetical protein